MAQEIDINQIQERAEGTIKSLIEMKKRGVKEKTMSIDGLLQFCDIASILCKRVKELEKEIKTIQDAFEHIR